ncbi:MAG TPA: hypothetical protein VL981_03525 [Candidatus Methylacidiphilales bacterium]|nr:hypothetical protein [Candidatus Methylacidiphilales bacterium]
MFHQLTPSHQSHPTTQTLPDIGWLRVRRKVASGTGTLKQDADPSWAPITSGPFIVPVTRWIE